MAEVTGFAAILKKTVEGSKDLIKHNERIFDILEGDLATQLKEKLSQQLSGDSSIYAMHRAAPINVLKKIIDKLSGLYTMPPARTTENAQDQELIDWYTHEMNINTYWKDANESFNAYKTMSLELFLDEGYLKTRAIRAAKYIAISLDTVNPMRVTHFVKIMQDADGNPKYWVYSENEFASYDKDWSLVRSDMVENEGINPFGVIPITYQTKSRYLLTPLPDTDTLAMTLLIPVLLTDLNFASMFLSNPIVWTSNAKIENIKLSPNMYWDLKGEAGGEKPEIGVIKPEPNIDAQLTLVKDQLGMWLQSRNIKPGAVGKLTVESAASGISLMIQEMDTTEDRLNQIPYFKEAEQDYWYRLAVMHNSLVNTSGFIQNKKFSDPEKLKVSVKYSEQKVFEARADKIDRLSKELAAGLISKRAAIKELSPDIDDDAIDIILADIKAERADIEVPTFSMVE